MNLIFYMYGDLYCLASLKHPHQSVVFTIGQSVLPEALIIFGGSALHWPRVFVSVIKYRHILQAGAGFFFFFLSCLVIKLSLIF
jgi:hypothetical protein